MTLSSQTSQDAETPSASVLNVFRAVIQSFTPQLQRQGIECELDVGSECRTDLAAEVIASVAGELIEDACDAMPGGGEISVVAVEYDEYLEIEIADSRAECRVGRLEQARDDRLRFSKCRDFGIGVETLLCPQGGLARTFRLNKRIPRIVNRAA